jgi:HEAT repeat protein
VPALIETLRDPEAYGVRENAAKALGQIGKNDVSVVEALTTATQDEDPRVRSAALKALAAVGKKREKKVTLYEIPCVSRGWG